MLKVYQQLVDEEVGDCMRATAASLLELPMAAVPHFLLSRELFHDVWVSFFWVHGWNYLGNRGGGVDPCKLKAEESIDGYFPASVVSFLCNGCTHSVIIDTKGEVVHDPSPSKYYMGRNIYGTAELLSWQGFSPRDDGWLEYGHVKNYLKGKPSAKGQSDED